MRDIPIYHIIIIGCWFGCWVKERPFIPALGVLVIWVECVSLALVRCRIVSPILEIVKSVQTKRGFNLID